MSYLLLIFFTSLLQAQTLAPILVESSKSEITLEQQTSQTSVRQKSSMSPASAFAYEELNYLPGVHVNKTGGYAGQTNMSIRGLPGDYSTLYLDGIKLNDPSVFGRGLDLSFLDTNNLEKIEVMKGPQSVLYGSDAISGVVNLYTRVPSKNMSSIGGQYGSFNTSKFILSNSQIEKRYAYYFNLSQFSSEGFSTAPKKNGNKEDDGAKSSQIFLKEYVSLSSRVEQEGTFYFIDSHFDQDDFNQDDLNYSADKKEVMLANKLNLKVNNYHKVYFQTSFYQVRRHNQDEDEIFNNSFFEGSNLSNEIRHNYSNGDFSHVLGVSNENELAHTDTMDKNAYSNSVFISEDIALSEKAQIQVGYRLQEHKTFGMFDVQNMGLAYQVADNYRLHSRWGSSFKAPTLYQLYDSTYGNLNLVPQRSYGYEFGQRLKNNNLEFEVNYFHQKIYNLIGSDGVTPYKQVEGYLLSRGIEAELEWNWSHSFKLLNSYTFTDSVDQDNQKTLKIPKHKLASQLKYKYDDVWTFSLQQLIVSQRVDFGDNLMRSYKLFDVATEYQIDKTSEIGLALKNLFNREYEEAASFSTFPLNFLFSYKSQF